MKLMNNLMKSILAIAMIAAMSACSMGGVTGNSSATEAKSTIQVSVDLARTALPSGIDGALGDAFYRLYAYRIGDGTADVTLDANYIVNVTNADLTWDVSADGLANLNTSLGTKEFIKGEEWFFILNVFIGDEDNEDNLIIFTADKELTITAGVNSIAFTLSLEHFMSYGKGTIDFGISDATADVYRFDNSTDTIIDEVVARLNAENHSVDVTNDNYMLKITKDGKFYYEFAVVLGGLTTYVNGIKTFEIDLAEPSSSEAANVSSSEAVTPSSSEETNVSSSDVSGDASSSEAANPSSSSDESDDSNSEAANNSNSEADNSSSNGQGNESSSDSSTVESSSDNGDDSSSNGQSIESSSEENIDSSSEDEGEKAAYYSSVTLSFDNEEMISLEYDDESKKIIAKVPATHMVTTDYGGMYSVDVGYDDIGLYHNGHTSTNFISDYGYSYASVKNRMQQEDNPPEGYKCFSIKIDEIYQLKAGDVFTFTFEEKYSATAIVK